jgi:hypothetical protein
MPRPADSSARPPEDFARLLAVPEPLLVVGGQAVNLWAIHYEERTRDLAPFVSRDADVLGDRETLALLGRRAGSKPQVFPLKPPSNEIGVVMAKDAAGAPLLIEVLRYVRGATNEELRDPVYEFAIGRGGTRVRVPGPIALLQAKIANLAELPQAGRQDARHILILLRVLPGYLGDLRESAAQAKLAERKLVEYLEKLLKILASKRGRKACTDVAVEPREVFAGLNPKGLPKLKRFLEERLP